MATHESPRFIGMTPVKADRQAEFESFIHEVIEPAVDKVRPELASQWQALRPAEVTDGVAVYGLMFHGDASLEDWDTATLFVDAYGPEEGARREEELDGFIAGEQAVYEFSGDVRD